MSFAWIEIYLSLNIMSVGFIHVVACNSDSLFSISLIYPIYTTIYLPFLLLIGILVICFGAIMYKAIMNIFLHIFWWT